MTNADDYESSGREFLITRAKSISSDLAANDFEKSVDVMVQIANRCVAEHYYKYSAELNAKTTEN